MPYISQEERKRFDREIDALLAKFKESSPDRVDGQLNYVISRLLVNLYEPRYFNYNRAMGVLASVTQEFYRRFVAPYEDMKIKENGDII